MKKLVLFKSILLVAFLCLPASGYAKKPVYVDASKFSDYFSKDGAREQSYYRYDSNRQLIMAMTVQGDSIIRIRYGIKDSKKEKSLLLKRDAKNPSQFYCSNFDRKKQKEFDVIIERMLSVLSVK
ncbi:MAG: hypothetical protein ACOYL8_01225 [Patescibacteria group bacterium]